MDGDKAFSFIKGLLIGAIGGAIAGVLLAPKSGEETISDIKKLAKEYEDKAMDIYAQSKKMLEKKIENVKKAGSRIDESKYMDLVNEVIEEVKSDSTVTADAAKKLGTQLRNDWDMVKKEVIK